MRIRLSPHSLRSVSSGRTPLAQLAERNQYRSPLSLCQDFWFCLLSAQLAPAGGLGGGRGCTAGRFILAAVFTILYRPFEVLYTAPRQLAPSQEQYGRG